MERIEATYFVETPLPLNEAAEILAGEQSCGTFVPVPGETAELKEQYAARVISVAIESEVNEPSLPHHTLRYPKYYRGEVKLSWPVANFGTNLPVLCSTLMGNLYELRQFTGIKLMDIEFPASYTKRFRGPRFGITGTLEWIEKSREFPLIGTIVKPSVGLTVADTVALVDQLASAGIDFIKDDELQGAAANSPFDRRVAAVMDVLNKYADKTGKLVMYAFNISDDMDMMLRNYETVVRHGGSCAMVSMHSVGHSAVKKRGDLGALAIHGHRNGWGMLNRHPLLGVDFGAYQKIWRLAGVDQLHVNGIQNKFWESDTSVVRSIGKCLEPMPGILPALPVVSSGQWGGQAMETYRLTATDTYLYLAGGGIMAHPDGIRGGVAAIRAAWQAAIDGLTIEEAMIRSPEFRKSVEKFGNPHKQ